MFMFEDSMRTTMDNSLKETMISQEGVFRTQVLELHRLYGIQRNLMERFGWKKMDEYDLWNETSHSAFPNAIQTKSPHLHHYVVECPKESLNLSLSLGGRGSGSEEAGSSKSWWFNHNPVIIDLEEPVVDEEKKKDDDDSCIIMTQAGSTSPMKGILDLNKHPEEEDNDNSSDTFLKTNILDLNSSDSSCSNGPEKCIDKQKETEPHGSNSNPSSCRVMDLEILEAVESLMSISLLGTQQQPERSMDSYELMVMNLKEEDYVCVSSKGCHEIIIQDKEEDRHKLIRRGRRVKDFQKDVLPSLACLSRHEIREDVNIMETVIRSREYKRIMKDRSSEKKKNIQLGGDSNRWATKVKRNKRSKLSNVNVGRQHKCFK